MRELKADLCIIQLHARLGEITYVSAASGSENAENSQKLFVDAIRRFCRAIELCEDYLRGYYGLVMVSDSLHLASATQIVPLNVKF